jgi:hypothetical protein
MVHPNILPLLGVFKDMSGDEAAVYMVSQWQDNGTLFHFVCKHPEEDKLKLVRAAV